MSPHTELTQADPIDVTTSTDNRTALIKLLCGSVCISFSPIFIKLANVSPDSAGFYRMLFAGLTLLPLMWLRGESLRMSRRSTLLLGGCGLLLAIDFMFWHRSIHLVGPGLSTLLGNFQVFFTALLSLLLFRLRITKMFMLAVVVALVGLFLITGIDWGGLAAGYRAGILFGLLTAVFYSGYVVTLKTAMSDPGVESVPAMLVVAIPSTLLLALVTTLRGASFAIPDAGSLFALLGVGIISTTLGWSLISAAIKQIPATIAGLVLLLQPTLALVWDVLLFERPLGQREIIGILLILSGIYVGSYKAPVPREEGA